MNSEAEQFLLALGGSFTFQTFDESNRKDRRLSRVVHGTLAEHASTLVELNARGAGAFVMVNEGDGKGRSIRNVQRVRAYFADLDGAPLAPVRSAPLPAHCIVESSPGRWHAYWLVTDAPLETFKQVQSAIAERFGADPKVCDLPRVMRLPGFLHCKGVPFRTQLADVLAIPRYGYAEFVAAFGIDLTSGHRVANEPETKPRKLTLAEKIPEGERNATLFDLACGLVRQGHDAMTVNRRIQKINAERCRPPLCAREVDAISTNAAAYASPGFIKIPHALVDSMPWKALQPCERDLVHIAFRRFNGSNNGNIALPWSECKWIRGCSDENGFYRHRANALASGIVYLAQKGRQSQRGRTPDLFGIASEWLPGKTRGLRILAKH